MTVPVPTKVPSIRGGPAGGGGGVPPASSSWLSAIHAAIPKIGDDETAIVMHNDAVVQGLSEAPFMMDVKRWGVLTIGTGLGNARFTNRGKEKNGKKAREKDKDDKKEKKSKD